MVTWQGGHSRRSLRKVCSRTTWFKERFSSLWSRGHSRKVSVHQQGGSEVTASLTISPTASIFLAYYGGHVGGILAGISERGFPTLGNWSVKGDTPARKFQEGEGGLSLTWPREVKYSLTTTSFLCPSYEWHGPPPPPPTHAQWC